MINKLIYEMGTDGVIESTGAVNASALLTSQIKIMVDGHAIGAVQSFEYSETNSEVTGNASRIFFDNMSIMECFGGKHHLGENRNHPFDTIKKFDIEIHLPDRITTIRNVIITKHHCAFIAQSVTVLEQISFVADRVYTKKVCPDC